MNAAAVPKDDRAFVADEFKWLDLGHDVAHEIVVRRQGRPVRLGLVCMEHELVTAGVDGEATAARRHVVEVSARVELLAHLIGVRAKRRSAQPFLTARIGWISGREQGIHAARFDARPQAITQQRLGHRPH